MISEEILPVNRRLSEHDIYLLEKSPFPMEQRFAEYAKALKALEKEYNEKINGKEGTNKKEGATKNV